MLASILYDYGRFSVEVKSTLLLGAYGEVWNPTDLYKIDMPEPLKEKQKEKAIKQAKKLLISEGIISESQLVS